MLNHNSKWNLQGSLSTKKQNKRDADTGKNSENAQKLNESISENMKNQNNSRVTFQTINLANKSFDDHFPQAFHPDKSSPTSILDEDFRITKTFKRIDFVTSRYSSEAFFMNRDNLQPLPGTQDKAYLITDLTVLQEPSIRQNATQFYHTSHQQEGQSNNSSPKMQLFTKRTHVNSSQMLHWNQLTIPIIGLENVGNSCYVNVVLQCLFYTTPLIHLIITYQNQIPSDASKFNALQSFSKLFANLQKTRQSLTPYDITNNLKIFGKQFLPGDQGDAHEFLVHMIDKFERALYKDRDVIDDEQTRNSNLVHQIFGGFLQSTVQSANFSAVTYDRFIDLSLPFTSYIEESLQRLFSPFKMEGQNMYYNIRRRSLEESEHTFLIHTAPPILILSIKRWDTSGKKINQHTQFNETLDIGPYTISKETQLYDLYAIIVHNGKSSTSGHYLCFVKTPAKIWYKIDDAKSYISNIKEVLNQSVYIMFYKKRVKDTQSMNKPKHIEDDLISRNPQFETNLEARDEKPDHAQFKRDDIDDQVIMKAKTNIEKFDPNKAEAKKRSSKYGQNVERWDNEQVELTIKQQNLKRYRNSDDIILDQGKQKKIRKPTTWRTDNPFQKRADYLNERQR